MAAVAPTRYGPSPVLAQSPQQSHFQSQYPSRPGQGSYIPIQGTSRPLQPQIMAQGQTPGHAQPTTHAPAPPRPPHYVYLPTLADLALGPRNRLFLALKSDIPSEVEWSLPKLVTGSYAAGDRFRLEGYVDGVSSLLRWPRRWVKQLAGPSAPINRPRRMGSRDGTLDMDLDVDQPLEISSSSQYDRPEPALWTYPSYAASCDPLVLKRATESLMVLRNAAFAVPSEGRSSNAEHVARSDDYIEFLVEFFTLPLDKLLETTLEYPEPVIHLFALLAFTLPFLPLGPRRYSSHTTALEKIFSTTLPRILIESRDASIMHLVLPLLISTASLPSFSPDPELILHLLKLITIPSAPSSPTLDLTLDLLVALTLASPSNSLSILASPNFPAHLRGLVQLLEHEVKRTITISDPPAHLIGKLVRNPANSTFLAEEASRRRGLQRDKAQKIIADGGSVEGLGLGETGDKPPGLSPGIRNKLYAMSEPRRSIAWMHETFVYSSTSQLLQVTFWHAYRDFFQHSKTVDPLVSASEVIRHVQIAFPGAMAKAYTDEQGQSRFVIAGMGFRKGSEDEDRFLCLWKDCEIPPTSTNPFDLFTHLQSHVDSPTSCNWASCSHSPLTMSHLLTHVPAPIDTPSRAPEHITTHPSMPEHLLGSSRITTFPPAPLGPSHKLHFERTITQTDPVRHTPSGTTFLAALIIRNLAKCLRIEVQSSLPLSEEGREEKKRHLMEERFGLPIPESVLREEEEEERAVRGDAKGDDGLDEKQRERARRAFEVLEGRLGEVIQDNMSGLGQYLVDALGW